MKIKKSEVPCIIPYLLDNIAENTQRDLDAKEHIMRVLVKEFITSFDIEFKDE